MAACGEDERPPPAREPARTVPVATAEPTLAAEGRLGRPVTVPAQANIFGAGRSAAPEPGGGGGGVLPPSWRLPDGKRRVVTVPRARGRVNPIVDLAPENGAGGDGVGPTDVRSHQGISGIVDRRNGMFLVGVFLTDAPPRKPAPPRLRFTRGAVPLPRPRIGQTFFIGDGRRRSFRVPAEATRLFLGFADAYLYEGGPG